MFCETDKYLILFSTGVALPFLAVCLYNLIHYTECPFCEGDGNYKPVGGDGYEVCHTCNGQRRIRREK